MLTQAVEICFLKEKKKFFNEYWCVNISLTLEVILILLFHVKTVLLHRVFVDKPDASTLLLYCFHSASCPFTRIGLKYYWVVGENKLLLHMSKYVIDNNKDSFLTPQLPKHHDYNAHLKENWEEKDIKAQFFFICI